MSKASAWFLFFLAVAVTVALLYYWVRFEPAPEMSLAPPAATEPAPPPPIVAEPRVDYPVPTDHPADGPPLPALEASDALSQRALGALIGSKPVEELARFPDFIRRVVATIDNLPRKKIALRLMPLKSVSGRFLVSGDSESATVHPGNSARYAAYVRLAEAVDTKKLAALYVRFYPLFQQAYLDLGYPNGYFNDRVVFVIDHLLAAPELQTAPRLVQPHVMYEYSSPELEGLSAGQKIMIRIGSENAARVKAKLRAIRAELVSLTPSHLQP